MIAMIKKMTALLLAATAFNNKAGWKLDADGKIEMKDGNPIWVDTEGNEKTLAADTIATLNSEAKQHRETAAAAIAKLKAYEIDGKLPDAETVKKSLDTVKNIDAKKLIDAGEVEKVRDQIKAEMTAQITEKDKALTDLQSKYDGLQVANVFNGSEFIRDRVAVPRDMLEASLRGNFKVEDGKITAYGRDGNRLMSKERIGEYAAPDEAIQLLIETHPQKDVILKASDANGSGNNGNGGGRGGNRVVKRADFEKLSPADQAATASKVSAGEIQLVD